MAQRFYKIDIQDGIFPMLSEQRSRTVMVSGTNQSPPEGERPGLTYCHNVMPTKYGLDSVGYTPVIPGIPGVTVNNQLVDSRLIYGSNGTAIDIAWDLQGRVYVLPYRALAWRRVPETVPPTSRPDFTPDRITLATVNDLTYIYYLQRGCFIYNEARRKLDPVTLTGLAGSVRGVVSAGGYLVAYTKDAIAWSSTISPTDFVPSPVTGAGGGDVQEAKGRILFCVPNDLGFLLYCENNVVAATLTGNAQYPFKFRQVSDSKGVLSLDQIAYETNSSVQFAYTKAGLQAITSQSARPILPEVTDFLSGRRFEDFNEETLQYELTTIAQNRRMKKKVKYIASRYLVISYGLESFTHALVYDNSLERMGKLKIDHTDVFEWQGRLPEPGRESLAFLSPNGAVSTVAFAAQAPSSGVMIFGKFQYSRNRWITMLGVEVENVGLFVPEYKVYDLAALDGKQDLLVAEGALQYVGGNLREHVFRITAKNHSIALIGKFNIVTAQIRYALHGRDR